MSGRAIFHICTLKAWKEAESQGIYSGTEDDDRDGFIHFSAREQAPAVAARYRAGQTGLVMLEVDTSQLGPVLKWESSAAGDLFPHLYGALPLSAVLRVHDLPLDTQGRHVFPPGFPPAPADDGGG